MSEEILDWICPDILEHLDLTDFNDEDIKLINQLLFFNYKYIITMLYHERYRNANECSEREF